MKEYCFFSREQGNILYLISPPPFTGNAITNMKEQVEYNIQTNNNIN